MIAITRELTSAIARCELTHLARSRIDVATSQREHAAYERALQAAGCTIERVHANDTMPDAVFIEDTAVVLDELAVITRPGAESRRAETSGVATALARHRTLATIAAPGTLDGGDVLCIGRRILVGQSPRSNDDGIAQLGAIVAPYGYTVETVPFQGCLHLKSAVTLVAPDLALINPAWLDASVLGNVRTIEVDAAEPHAANALLIGDIVIYPAEHRATAALLELAGIELRRVPAGELAKAEGGVTGCCLLVTEVRLGSPPAGQRTAPQSVLQLEHPHSTPHRQ